jgi:predicted nucleotidyltransferase
MRLSEEYRTVIKETLLKHFGKGSKFYLFGSRIDDSKRGGDIDLYIETDLSDDKPWKAKKKAHRELMDVLGEQKIDIIVHVNGSEYTAFEELIKDDVVEL